MPRPLLSCGLLVGLPLLALLGGCCLGECVGSPESALVYFRFSADTVASGGRGFRRVELRSAYLVLYRDARLTQPRDTQRVLPRRDNLPLYLGSERHDFQVAFTDDSLTSFIGSYRIAVPAAGKHYDVRQHFVPTKRSTCPAGCKEAQGVRFQFDGQPVSFDTPTPSPANAVIISR